MQNPFDKCEHSSNGSPGNSSVAAAWNQGDRLGSETGEVAWETHPGLHLSSGDRPGAGQLEGVNTWAGAKDTQKKGGK